MAPPHLSGPLSLASKALMKSGYEIPLVGYGSSNAQDITKCVQKAIEIGYRHVDSAILYANEKGCADGFLASGLPREEFFFTSKVPNGKINYEGAKASVEETLKLTGFSYIDLYLLHCPHGGKEGRLGAWKALVEAVKEGKVRSIGVSNFGIHHLEELEAYIQETDKAHGPGAGGVLSINQVELHPWLARKEIHEWCDKHGVLLQAYCPLVRARRMDDPLLLSISKKHGKTPAQVLVRWSLQQGFITLPKSSSEERMKENIGVFDFSLDESDMKALDTGAYEPCCWDPTVMKD